MSEPALVGRMELRLNEAEKRLAKFTSTVDRQMGTMEKRTDRASARMQSALLASVSKINTTLAGLGITGAAGLALFYAATERTKKALEDFGNIADASAASGLDAEFFQGLTYQASLAGVSMEQLSKSLEVFSKNSGLAVVGKGKMVAALQKLNPALLENIRNADSQEERVKLAADAIDAQATASGKAALATTLFGNAGTRLTSVFTGGAAAIDETMQKARELGIIIDRDLIARADEMGDKFDTVSQILETRLNKAFVDLGPVLIGITNFMGRLAEGASIVADKLRDVADRSTELLQIQQTDIAKERLDLETRILEIKGRQRDGTTLMDSAELAGLEAKNDALTKQDELITNIINQRNKSRTAASGSKNTAGTDTVLDPLTVPSKPRSKATTDAERQAKAIKDLIANLEFELSLVGKSDVEIAKANALRQAGATATQEQKDKIEALVEATDKATKANEANAASIQLQKDIVAGALSDIRSAFEDGKITAKEWGDVLVNMLDKVIDKLQTDLVNALFSASSTGGFNIFGLLGGAATSAGGTSGAVASAASAGAAKSAQVLPRSAGSMGGTGVHVTFGIAADGNGNIMPFVQGVAREEAGRMGRAVQQNTEAYTKGQMHRDINRHLASPRRSG